MSPLSFTSATGPVQNPWLYGYTTGGSSSGPATLVAIKVVNGWRKRHGLPSRDNELGLGVDMAIGGDQGGSIRIPAGYCGIYGLKPTHGLIPYTGIMGLHPMIDHTGPLAASLEDVATLLSVLAGYDGIDPRMTPESPLRKDVKDYPALLQAWIESRKTAGEWTSSTSGKGLRIGVIKESLEVIGLSPNMKSAFNRGVERFKAIGAEVVELSIPLHLLGPSIWTIATRMGLSHYGFQNNPSPLLNYPLPDVAPPAFNQKAFDLLTRHNPAVVNIFLSHQLLARDPARLRSVTAKAMMHVHQLRAAYDAALADVDVLITPVNPRVGSKHPTLEMSVKEKMAPGIGGTLNTCGFNVSGHPGLSIPVGFEEVDGADGGKMPVGMQIVGRRWDEETVLRVAKAWEVPGLGLDSWDGR
jgi:amidase